MMVYNIYSDDKISIHLWNLIVHIEMKNVDMHSNKSENLDCIHLQYLTIIMENGNVYEV